MLLLAVFFFVREREPWHRGHPLSYWIEPWQNKNESPETVSAVYAEMDQRAVRWLAQEVSWRPSVLWAVFARSLNGLGVSAADELDGDRDRRPQAAMALARLGERAQPAIAALEAATRTTAGRRAFHARYSAMAALIVLGREPKEKHLAVLLDTSNPQKWYEEWNVIASLGTNGIFAMPVLLEIAKSTNNIIIKAQAANLAGNLEPRPEFAVPLLKQAMESPPIRETGLYGLRRLGTNAAAATETVVGYLTDANARVRWAATNILRSVNPAKAEELFGK